jgi:hypothetical protein
MRTPLATGSRCRDFLRCPIALRRINDSSVVPIRPKLRLREQSPPMDRAATSMIRARSPSTRNSTCTGPDVSPRARIAAAATRSASAIDPSGRRDGVMNRVSGKYGPDDVSGLSNTARTVSSPSAMRPSIAISVPGTNPSTNRVASAPTILRILSTAGSMSPRRSTRITPWLAERSVGLITSGNPTFAATSGES